MKVDHLTIAGPDLKALQQSFAEAGLKTLYGGVHSNGITHMSLASFADGSYLELVSPVSGGRVPIWSNWSMPESGGTAWTVLSDDVAEELQRARALGIEGTDPITVTRKRPDGVVGEWELGYLGNRQPGGLLPFLIRDFSPRAVRVPPSSNFNEQLLGWSRIVITVDDLPSAVESFQRLYGWPAPHLVGEDVWFSGTPVVLRPCTTPTGGDGASVSAAILDCAHAPDVTDLFCFAEIERFLGERVGWLELQLPQIKIGIRLPSC